MRLPRSIYVINEYLKEAISSFKFFITGLFPLTQKKGGSKMLPPLLIFLSWKIPYYYWSWPSCEIQCYSFYF